MHPDVFDYPLPESLIAQHPASPRDASRLMRVGRATGARSHLAFRDLPSLLDPGDLLVLNDTRVIAARLVGRRASTGGKWEGLFVRAHADGLWEIMLQTRGTPAPGETLFADPPGGGPPLELDIVAKTPAGRRLVRPRRQGAFAELLSAAGQIPIPPYIRRGRAEASDLSTYQTVYARNAGAVAAPTAGLHFTDEVFAALDAKGVGRAFVTLHVGPGTFQPVKAEDVRDHRVEAEWGEVPAATARLISATKAAGRRVIAVGTTSTRVLETWGGLGRPDGWAGETGLTIVPPFAFGVLDGLVTNFHLPRSSLLLLVAAFVGEDATRDAYAEAVREKYRFYSYGDAMAIL